MAFKNHCTVNDIKKCDYQRDYSTKVLQNTNTLVCIRTHAKDVVSFHSNHWSTGAVPITGAFLNHQWPLVIYDINCTGSEQTVKDCPHNGIVNHLCQQTEAASLICQSEYSGLVRFIS